MMIYFIYIYQHMSPCADMTEKYLTRKLNLNTLKQKIDVSFYRDNSFELIKGFIMKTCPFNIQIFLSALKLKISLEKI